MSLKLNQILNITALSIGFCALSLKTAFAGPSGFLPVYAYQDFYTVANSGNTTQKTEFGWDEKPWFYIDMGNPPDQRSSHFLSATWDNPSGPDEVNWTYLLSRNGHQLWFSFTDARWSSIKRAGDWALYSFATMPNTNFEFEDTSAFHVNAAPEPKSALLFLAGVGLFSVVLYRRKYVAHI